MSFQANIPQSTDFLSQSQLDLLNNFTALNNVFGIDHSKFDASVPPAGYHTDVHLQPVNLLTVPIVPVASSDYGQLYSVNDTLSPSTNNLFYNNGNTTSGGATQVTYAISGQVSILSLGLQAIPVITGNVSGMIIIGTGTGNTYSSTQYFMQRGTNNTVSSPSILVWTAPAGILQLRNPNPGTTIFTYMIIYSFQQ